MTNTHQDVSPGNAVTLGATIEEVIKAKTAANRRPAYVRHLRFSLRAFARGRDALPITDVGRRHIEDWFATREHHSPSTRRGLHQVLSVLFAHAVRVGYIPNNPCLQIEKPTVDRNPPRILTPAEARKMLNFARRKMMWRLPQIVLGLYGGIRPTELSRLYWKHVNLDGAYVVIDAAASKTRRRRIVRLEPKAVAWLRRCKVQHHRPIGTLCWKWRRLVERHCGFKWDQDILRHSAASYLLALHGDVGRVARTLGNSAQVTVDHYIELVTPQDCRRFWYWKTCQKT